jgi:DNA-binding NarL/FixJ family response regulator
VSAPTCHDRTSATGERASKRTGIATDELTPQEAQVARLVAEGSSNRGVAAQLYISPNTVEYYLQKVFRKVGVSSRTQLAHAMLDRTQDGSATAARRHVIAVSHAGRPPVPLPRAS